MLLYLLLLLRTHETLTRDYDFLSELGGILIIFVLKSLSKLDFHGWKVTISATLEISKIYKTYNLNEYLRIKKYIKFKHSKPSRKFTNL